MSKTTIAVCIFCLSCIALLAYVRQEYVLPRQCTAAGFVKAAP